MKIQPAVLFALLAFVLFVAGTMTVTAGILVLTVISYAIMLPAFAVSMLMAVISGTGEWKPIQIGKVKAVPDDEYIRELESELGMDDLDHGDQNEALPWLSNYPIPAGWRWEFAKEGVVTTKTLTGEKSTTNQLAVYLITDTDAKWKLIGTHSNDHTGENNTKWVNPVPADTFEKRLEQTVSKTYDSVMSKHKGELAMDDLLSKFSGKKNGGKKQIEW